jgi:hypothetical protein
MQRSLWGAGSGGGVLKLGWGLVPAQQIGDLPGQVFSYRAVYKEFTPDMRPNARLR